MENPIISIICNTYNQEKYIADALDSFLMQKVNVPFEILVHDDASTDSTPDIIREYEKKHPDIVKPIYQNENQYSKNVSITATIQIPRAKGKYIAFCEGDDYWTDPQKLQIQYDFMESNEQYSACCHAYNMVDKEKKLMEKRCDFIENCDVPMERLIGNQLEVPHFATLFVRMSSIADFKVPFLDMSCNDMIIRIYCATKGNIYYFNRIMSCYRRFSESSWTVSVSGNSALLLKSFERYIPFLEKLNLYTDGKYKKEIEKSIDQRKFNMDLLKGDYNKARKRMAYSNASIKKKIYITIGCFLPSFINALRKIS